MLHAQDDVQPPETRHLIRPSVPEAMKSTQSGQQKKRIGVHVMLPCFPSSNDRNGNRLQAEVPASSRYAHLAKRATDPPFCIRIGRPKTKSLAVSESQTRRCTPVYDAPIATLRCPASRPPATPSQTTYFTGPPIASREGWRKKRGEKGPREKAI